LGTENQRRPSRRHFRIHINNIDIQRRSRIDSLDFVFVAACVKDDVSNGNIGCCKISDVIEEEAIQNIVTRAAGSG
jgi:hypothetical protein